MAGGVFITATGTDVGKTHVACAVIRAFRRQGLPVEAFKPVVSGIDMADWTDSDPGRLLSALGRPLTPDSLAAISPWRFTAPLSPDQAAGLEGRALSFAAVLAASRRAAEAAATGALVIEGVGGVMSPIASDATNLDLIEALDLPVVLVAGSYLGAISHSLTALEVLRARGASVKLLVISESEAGTSPVEMIASIRRMDRTAPPMVILPRGGSLEPHVWLAALR
jgi:dethiobiotin synthetase